MIFLLRASHANNSNCKIIVASKITEVITSQYPLTDISPKHSIMVAHRPAKIPSVAKYSIVSSVANNGYLA
jgi:hypothetical protein